MVAACCLFLMIGGTPGWAQQDNRFEVSKNLDIFNSLLKEVEMFYVDSVDVEKSVRRGIDAMLSGLDPYTEYYPEQDMEELNLMTTGEYGGIGALIRQRNNDGHVMIAEPIEGMPADLAGLKAGDLILAIDTTDVSRASNERVSELLKGVPNTKMVLTIQRPGEKKTRKVEITRKQIVTPQVTYYGTRNDSVGYIYLKAFTIKSAQEVKEAFLDLKRNHGIKSLILDLRGNGGGVLEGAVQIVGMFVPKGSEVLSTKGKIKQWDRVYRTSVEPLDTVMPLAVLINGGSASAAEIVSGALQDMDRAVLVGQRSFGKGLVQSTHPVGKNDYVKLTTAKYYTPSGRCIQAVDYSHRNEDGSVGTVPDSLIRSFRTAAGRTVYDGGGIMPDRKTPVEYLSKFTGILIGSGYVDDFANRYAVEHAPQRDFVVDDSTYAAFCRMMADRPLVYESRTERLLEQLRAMAEREKYADRIGAELDAIADKIKDDQQAELEAFESEIRTVLADAIMMRWYYDAGRIEYQLRRDKTARTAADLLLDRAEYTRIVTTQDTDKK